MLYETIMQRIPIDRGWSGDRKYRIECADGNTYLLRVSPAEKAERRREEFRRTCQVASLGVSMDLPLEFSLQEEGACTILSWVDGYDAEEFIPTLPREEQYRLGLDAGRILRKMHTLPAPDGAEPWEQRFNQKIDRKIAMYEACPLKYEGGTVFLKYIGENRHLLANRPQSYQHGDYHIGNMMVTTEGILTVIDFEKDDYGDPWEEFNRIVWSAQAAPRFAAGMVDGYFGGDVPMDFWKLLALYICSNSLSSLPWAIPFGEKEIRVMRDQAAQVLQWYDSMNHPVPAWYRE